MKKPVRNYDNPDPKAVLRNIAAVLSNQDMNRLRKPAYQFLITHCGFIAHYNLEGFKAEYQDHLDDFVEFFLGSHLGNGWDTLLDNPMSYLYDMSYRGVMLHQVVRELVALFQEYKDRVDAGVQARRTAQKLAMLNRLAEELRDVRVPKEVPNAQET